MNRLLGLFASFIFSLVFTAQAQDASALLNEGNKFYDSKDFAAAALKYQEVLKQDPENIAANYKLAFSLNATGKNKEALLYLQKVVKSDASAAVLGSSYSLMAGIYDKAGSTVNAINSYQKAIQIDSTNYLLQYGVGLAYFRSHQYEKAEESAIEALTLNPEHAASMRLYALVTFHQNKRAPALLGLCSFLSMEPRGQYSAEANNNLRSILKGGTLKSAQAPLKITAQTKALNQAIADGIAAKRNVKAGLSGEQLQAVFAGIGMLAEKQSTEPFFRKQAESYYKLSKTSLLPAFANYISQNVDKTAAAWLASHPKEAAKVKEWINSQRGK